MKQLSLLMICLVILGMSMVWVQPSYATGVASASFEVDCFGAHGAGVVPEGETYHWRVELRTPVWDGGTTYFQVTGSVTGPAAFDVDVPWPTLNTPTDWFGVFIRDSNNVEVYGLESQLDCPPPPQAEVCSPGYWKNHTDSWVGYDPGDDFDSTFGVDLFSPDITLLEALRAKGGGVNKMARLGTASLLNATALNFPLTPAEVIAAVQNGNVALLESFAENCPID